MNFLSTRIYNSRNATKSHKGFFFHSDSFLQLLLYFPYFRQTTLMQKKNQLILSTEPLQNLSLLILYPIDCNNLH
jgi:hypothetical protein